MTDNDLTLAILREIRDGIRTTNERIDETRKELSARIDETRTDLGARIDRVVHEQIRHATAIVELEAAQRETVDQIRNSGETLRKHGELLTSLVRATEGINARIDNVFIGPLGQKVRELEDRIDRLEKRPAPPASPARRRPRP